MLYEVITLIQQLEIRSTETRHRFESFLHEWSTLGHSFAQHWRLVEYLNNEVLDQTLEAPNIYSLQHPPVWLEPGYPRLSSIDPAQIMILDGEGIPREIYEAKARITSYNVCYTKLLRVWSTLRYELFFAKADMSVAAVARFYIYFCIINKIH